MPREIKADTYVERADTVNIHHQETDPALKAGIEALLNRASVADEARANTLAGEKILDDKIKQSADLIKERKFLAARNLLIALISGETPDNPINPLVKARIKNNLGICFLQLDETSAARDEFDAALQLDPDNVKFLGNAAMGALIAKDPDAAIELSCRVRSVSPDDSLATSVYIQALNATNKRDEIQKLIDSESWIMDDAHCLLALGTTAYFREEYEKAEEYLQASLVKDNTEPQTYNLLANSIFQPIINSLQKDPPLPWKKPESLVERIEQAKNFADQDVELLKNVDNRRLYVTALINRAQIRASLGDYEGALEDCQKALAEAGNDSRDYLLNTKGITLFNLKRYPEAIQCLEKATEQSARESGSQILAMAYIHESQPEKAIELLQQYWNPEATSEKMIGVAEVLTIAYAKDAQLSAGNTDEILKFLNQPVFAENVNALHLKSDNYYNRGDYGSAETYLLRALEYATENQKDRLHLTLAEQAYFRGNYKNAAEYYSLVIDSNAPLNLKQQYVISLMNGEKYDEAFAFCIRERNNGEPIPVITEAEARLLEYIGDLPAALELRLKLQKNSNEVNESHLIKAFMLALRLGRDEAAREIIERVDLSKIQESPWALSHVAQAYTIAGIKGAIPLAYRALQLGFEHPEYHLAYNRVFLAREDPEADVFRMDKIENDCVVEILLSTGEKQFFTITDQEPPNKQKNIIALNDPLAKKLLGKTAGEEIVIKESRMQTLTARVLEIKSKYVYAFQNVFTKFSTYFPDNDKLFSIDVADNDFSVIFSELDRRYAHVSFIMKLHNEKRLPLSVLAKFLDRSRTDTWNNLLDYSEGNIYASQGGLIDARQITSKKVVLDLIAILTLDYLGMLDKLSNTFDEVYVSQTVLDELNESLLTERIDSGKKRAHIGRYAEGYRHRDYTEDELNQYLEFLTRIRDFITHQTSIIPNPGALAIDKSELNKWSDILGESAVSSIMVARDLDALLYADDMTISQIAAADWNVKSVWSQTLLIDWLEREIISEEEYHQAIYRLITANYKFVSINYETVKWAVEENNWKPTSDLQRFMKTIEGPAFDENWAVETIADLIKESVLRISQPENRTFFIDFILKFLIKDRNQTRVLSKLQLRIQDKFELLPIHLPEILRTINIWKNPALIQIAS